MVVNVVSYWEIKHAKPMVLFVLGAVCIVDMTRRLKNWEGLKVKRVAQRTYQQPFSMSAIAWYALSLVLGGAWVVAVIAFAYLTQGFAHTNLASTIVFFLITAGLAGTSYYSYHLSRQHRASGAGSVLQKDQRRPILLLRSFADDMIAIKRDGLPLPFYLGEMRGLTFEEIITSELARYGPVVAIGRPGESLPPIGAAREYVANEDWQRRLSSLLPEALAIVVVVGATKGLSWELREIFNMGAQRKVLLVLPPRKAMADQEDLPRRWKAFYELMREAGEWNLPDQINIEKTLLIDVEKSILYEGTRHAPEYRAALERAIKCLVGQKD